MAPVVVLKVSIKTRTKLVSFLSVKVLTVMLAKSRITERLLLQKFVSYIALVFCPRAGATGKKLYLRREKYVFWFNLSFFIISTYALGKQ